MAICFLLIANNIFAADKGLVLNLGSRHVVTDYIDYNEKNYGLGYTKYYNDNTAVQFGIYDNSINNWSLYVAYKMYGFTSKRVKPYVLVGGATGYENSFIAPWLGVGVDLEIVKTHKLNITASPIRASVQDNVDEDYHTNYGVLLGFQYEKLF